MTVKWKKNKKLKPDIILQKIKSFTVIGEDNKVSFSGFGFNDAIASLHSMLKFPKKTEALHLEYVILKAISNAAKENDLSSRKVIIELNKIVKDSLATKEQKYHLLTSISLASPLPAQNIEIENCRVRIFDKPNFPAKYKGREELIEQRKIVSNPTPQKYSKIIATVKSPSPKGAATSALRAIDILRAFWCLFGNSSMEIWGNEWQPINRVRLGGAHTVHKENGKIATETFWYEPNFEETKVFKAKSPDIYKKKFKWSFNQLKKSAYRQSIKDSLLRYVRALDERDQNIAIIRLWGALESLTTPSQANYDLVTRRCSFLFKEQQYNQQVLEHLREYRNQSVHAGDQSDRAKTYCFQLQFYFYNLIIFHLKNAQYFSSLDEANNFLDMPTNKKVLERKKSLINKAIKFTS